MMCVACAWDITRGIFEPDIFRLMMGVVAYFGWEMLRDWEINKGA